MKQRLGRPHQSGRSRLALASRVAWAGDGRSGAVAAWPPGRVRSPILVGCTTGSPRAEVCPRTAVTRRRRQLVPPNHVYPTGKWVRWCYKSGLGSAGDTNNASSKPSGRAGSSRSPGGAWGDCRVLHHPDLSGSDLLSPLISRHQQPCRERPGRATCFSRVQQSRSGSGPAPIGSVDNRNAVLQSVRVWAASDSASTSARSIRANH